MGKLSWANGSRYHGQWVSGVREGHGAFYYANGDIFCGGWSGGKKHGPGNYFYKASGAHVEGLWEDGVLVSGKFLDKFGASFSGSFSAGEEGIFCITGVAHTASGAVVNV